MRIVPEGERGKERGRLVVRSAGVRKEGREGVGLDPR